MSTSAPRKAAYHHGDLAGALVDAALAVLKEIGDPAALTLREAARRAGVSPMAPYRHFADKDALLAAVAKVGFDRLAAALRKADRAESDVDALVGQGVAYVAFACANPALFRLMFGTALAQRSDALDAADDNAYAVMADRVAAIVGDNTVAKKAIRKGAPSRSASADWALRCWATAHGLAALAVDGQLARWPEKPAALAGRILRLSGVPPS